jgi:hypothetical protein
LQYVTATFLAGMPAEPTFGSHLAQTSEPA